MKFPRYLIGLAICCLLSVGCVVGPAGEDIVEEQITYGDISVSTAGSGLGPLCVYRDEACWLTNLEIAQTQLSLPELPAVDFETQMVIDYLATSSGCNHIHEIISVIDTGDRIVITEVVKEESILLGEGIVCGILFTTQATMIVVPRSDKPVELFLYEQPALWPIPKLTPEHIPSIEVTCEQSD